jgi:predicted Zn-dependent protease
MINATDVFLDRYELSEDNFLILAYRAGSYANLGEADAAIEDYRKMVPFINSLGNVKQREYSYVFFSLGYLYAEKNDEEKALGFFDYGLTLDPSNFHQIRKGKIYEDLGQTNEALNHYRSILSDSSLTAEQRATLRLKISRLTGNPPPVTVPEVESYFSGPPFILLPINNFTSDISLDDMCMIIKSKFRSDCKVGEMRMIDEDLILNRDREQYDSGRIIEYLNKTFLPGNSRGYHIAITDKNIYRDDLEFVFDTVDNNVMKGVMSTYIFNDTLAEDDDRISLLGRRAAIQLMSTIGKAMRWRRPTRPECPLAYVHSLYEFTLKSTEFCESTENYYAQYLEFTKDHQKPLTQEEKESIKEVYQKYYIE